MQITAENTGECPATVVVSPQPSGSPKRLLVVEDSRCVQMRLLALLRSIGLDADVADDGEVACKRAVQSQAAGHPYDVILMDVQMPKMNGKQAAKWLREHGWSGPIIAISMHSTEKDNTAFLAAGFSCLLPKPFTQVGVREALAAYLGTIETP
jgi:CheY-like chemotaxis protein